MPYTFRHGDRPLDGYTVQRAVGRGGFGEVYYALADSGKQVALKYLRESPEIELRGIALVINLKSPHLVTIFDVCHSAEGEPFVIMEYVSGPSLRDVLRVEAGPMAAEKAAFFLGGIANGLSHLHDRGVVHRDLKPANIFYDSGYVKIGDYGLSKHMSVSRHSGQTVSIGTVHYMAPEIGSGSYTKQVDIYSLGAILFEMLAGRPPFTGASIQEVLVRQLRDQPDTSLVPPAFAPIVARALAKDPAERYQDVNEMADAVTRLTDVQTRLDSFDPLTLSQVPRVERPPDTPVTPTAPPPRVEPLDARAAAAQDTRTPQDGARTPYPPPPHPDFVKTPDVAAFDGPLAASIILGGLLALLALVRVFGPSVIAIPWFLTLIPFLIAKYTLMYRWWASLPVGWRRTTPARAVGFCFIPVFNLYWVFIANCGLVTDVDRCLNSKRLSSSAPFGLAVAYCVLSAVRIVLFPTPAHGVLSVASLVCYISFAVQMTRACKDLVRTQMQFAPAYPALRR